MYHRYPPTPPGHPLWGNLFQYSRAPFQFLLSASQRYGDILRLRFMTTSIYIISQPTISFDVLAKRTSAFDKDQVTAIGKFIGSGLNVNEGGAWKQRRNIAQSAFHAQQIDSYAEAMKNCITWMLNAWQSGNVLDINQEMTQLMVRIVAHTLFGAELAPHTAATVGKAMALIERAVSQQVTSRFLPSWLPTPQNLALRHMTKALETLARQIVEERRTGGGEHDDLLSMLLQADEDGEHMTDGQILDEIMTLLLAGHASTASALTWMWYVLSQYPEAEARIHEEIDRVLDGRLPTIEDLAVLPYVDMVVKEVLRLYPPLWLIGRQAREEVTIGDYQLARGSLLFICPYIIQHNSELFEQPEAFFPERFSKQNEKRIPHFAYIPFGGGPRSCIGARFATMAMKLTLVMVAQQYKLALTPGQKVEIQPLLSLRPKDGMRVSVSRRVPRAVQVAGD